ncbi:hypothetical protein Gogos_017524 [Gossypium gossypioides]|uniref:Uncharacterized protein n=1 Tax=Gossypium gossypioides TaxID=34282 RepID=A0A7J9BB66_GOSGO|nr:hypothetical protein [Gossypium gossypioides]
MELGDVFDDEKMLESNVELLEMPPKPFHQLPLEALWRFIAMRTLMISQAHHWILLL